MGLIYQSEEHGQAVSDYGHDDATQRCDLVKFQHASFIMKIQLLLCTPFYYFVCWTVLKAVSMAH